MIKEDYLTIERASEIYTISKKYSKDNTLYLTTNRLILLVVDMQEYFLSKESNAYIPSAPKIVNRINKLIEMCKEQNIPFGNVSKQLRECPQLYVTKRSVKTDTAD